MVMNTTGTGSYKQKYVDHSEGQREGNRRNVADIITQGLVMSHGYDIDKAFSTYEDIHARLVAKDAKAHG